MRKAIGFTLALLVALGCLGFAKGLVYAVEAPLHVGNAVWHNSQALLMTPFHSLSSLPFWMCFLLSIFVVAWLLRWAFGRENAPAQRTDTAYTPRENNVNLDVLARDLDRVARRLEERIDALETILLNRDRTA